MDGLIAFAVDTANQCLVPRVCQGHWDKLSGAERFFLKMLDMEARGAKTLDNYQNFAKAFKVHDFRALLGEPKANDARLKSAVEFGRAEMGEGSELHESVLRAVLFAVMELVKDVDGTEVLAHLTLNIPDYYGDMTQRELAVELAGYLDKRLDTARRGQRRPCAARTRQEPTPGMSRATDERHHPLLVPAPAPRPCLPWRQAKRRKSYKRIAGYFRSSIFELVGEEIAAIPKVQIVCNSELDADDVVVSKHVAKPR